MTIKKRLDRLEAGREAGEGYLPVVGLAVIDDMACDKSPLSDWPEQVAGCRLFDGREWRRRDDETPECFRQRVSVEIGTRGPPGALPNIVELILSENTSLEG